MPLRKPKAGETQAEWMAYCMHVEYGEGSDRPQEQAVAICLNAWRAERGGPPPPKSAIDDWMARCREILARNKLLGVVWEPGEVGENGLPANYQGLLDLLTEIDSVNNGNSNNGNGAKKLSLPRTKAGKTTPEAPYGEDTNYADLGYQEDGVKRYPIDTETHIRAAWNYIHKSKNQEPYTHDQVRLIKSRIVKAWRAKIDEEGPPGLEDDEHLGKRARRLRRKAVNNEDIDVPEPEDDESEDDFLDRCIEDVTDQDVDESHANSLCALAWENRSAAGRMRHKVHAEVVSSDMLFTLSDETPDRMGDVISSNGWDIENFKKNPIALFNHKSDFIVGKWQNLHVADKCLRGHLRMAPAGTSERIDEIRKLIEADILKAVSVGFRPISSQRRMQGDKAIGEHFLRQELVETSLVSVPANPNALAIAKSLDISDGTLDLVFAEQGIRSKTFAPRRSPGEHAERKTVGQRGDNIMSLAQRIQDKQAGLVTLRDEVNDYIATVPDDNVSDSQLEHLKELNARYARAEQELSALQESERFLFTKEKDEHRSLVLRQDGNGGNGSVIAKPYLATSRSPAMPKSRDERLDLIARAGVAGIIAHIRKVNIEVARELISREYPRYSDDATKVFCDYVSKAPAAPAMTTVTGWAAELVQQVHGAYMELLYPQSVFPRLSPLGTSLTFGRAGRILGLDRFLAHVQDHSDVWITSRTEIARFWASRFAPADAWNWP